MAKKYWTTCFYIILYSYSKETMNPTKWNYKIINNIHLNRSDISLHSPKTVMDSVDLFILNLIILQRTSIEVNSGFFFCRLQADQLHWQQHINRNLGWHTTVTIMFSIVWNCNLLLIHYVHPPKGYWSNKNENVVCSEYWSIEYKFTTHKHIFKTNFLRYKRL